MRNIYCISGLCADSRIFSNLSVADTCFIHISWPEYEVSDTMETYAMKVSEMITESNPIIVGLSFGGMLATQIAKIRDVEKVILISSAKNVSEKPAILSLFKSVINADILPSKIYKTTNPFLFYLFGTESIEDKNAIREIIKNSDAELMKRCI